MIKPDARTLQVCYAYLALVSTRTEDRQEARVVLRLH